MNGGLYPEIHFLNRERLWGKEIYLFRHYAKCNESGIEQKAL